MQLVAYGAQDIYLTGNPQITFFKVVYRRHTNFSMEAIAQTWNGSETSAGRCTATISRNGDLVYRMYLELKCAAPGAGTNADISSSAINDVELEIGGQKIDKHTGHWMNVWSHLSEPNPSGRVSGGGGTTNGTLFQNMSGMGGVADVTNNTTAIHNFVPLQFWFCRNPGLALPLIALQYHEVKVILDHTISTVYSGANRSNTLWCDYIYLDTDERRRFAQVSHEYLIEQVQEGELSTGTNDLNFNHPVKELIFTAGTVSGSALEGSIQLKLNGHDRFAARDIKYFTRTQIWEHHSGAGGLKATTQAQAADGKFIDTIGVYSFALKPEEHQPSGTCNFSRIDNAQLTGLGGGAAKIFAVNYNVLRIMSGMGGLAYSN